LSASSAARRTPPTCGAAAQNTLRCFHPTGVYTRCESISPTRATIAFQGILSRSYYELGIEKESKPGFSRITVTRDTAMAPPSKRCALVDWQPDK